MESRKQITVIGATGNIGAPVVKNLINTGYHVKVIARNKSKAQQLFKNLENIEILQADIKDVSSLKISLKHTEYLYLNLSTTSTDIKISFATEREGMANILKAIDGESIKQIITISGLGALDNFNLAGSFKFIPNIIRKQGHRILKDTGIPYTILHCSWFIDNCVFYRRNGVYSVIGNTKSPIYFTNCYDYSMNLIHAVGNENAFYKEFPVQGDTGYLHTDAAKDFLSVFSPESKVTVLPKKLIQVLALFSKEMKFVKHMSDYSHLSKESHIAEEYGTYATLGRPQFNVKDYAEWLKSENLYNYIN
jgi:hypothetical protein